MFADDMTLATQCHHLADLTVQASLWANNNREVVRGERDGLLAELRRAGRLFRQCEVAAQRKMCAGVFGPSQAGKSYLISALARNEAGTLLADFDGQVHDFISEINPEGGKESTGLVTRFTMSCPDTLPAGHPVRLRLLTETDLVKILANTYYADCEHKDTPDPKAVDAALDVLERKVSGQTAFLAGGVSLDDLEDLREYVVKAFRAKPRVQELERCFWTRAFELGPKLALNDRVRLYALLWDNVEPFTQLLQTLAEALSRLGNPAEAFAPLDALIPRNGSIIDVAMLAGLGEDSVEGKGSLELVTQKGKQAVLPRAVVTALTAELTIVMREKPDDYFDHTDLLDFPGYRSRYKIDDLRRELTKPGMQKELFLRGKVAYLFQRYCAERELTSMLLCIGPSNQEVQDLPGVINDWILSTHGESPERRQGQLKALYFVLTKFDMEFEQKKGAPSVETRWDNRLHASLLDYFGKQHDWPLVWDKQSAFNNLFLLRNPNFRFDAVLDYDEQGLERGVRPDQQGYVNELETAFMNSHIVAQHFENPRAAWDAAMSLNDGGIGFLREKLRPLCNPVIKRQQLTTALAERQERLAARLKPFWKPDNREEERKQKTILGQLLAVNFANLAAGQLFGEFLQRLTVHDHELYELYFEAERRRGQEPLVSVNASSTAAPVDAGMAVGVAVNADDILADLFGDAPLDVVETGTPGFEGTADSFGDASTMGVASSVVAKPVDQAHYFAALIESHWLGQLHRLADDVVLQKRYGLSGKIFSQFVSELGLGAERLGLRHSLVNALRKASSYANVQHERLIWKQVSWAATLLNAYVSWLGYNPREQSQDARTVFVAGRSVVLFESPVPVQGYPHIGELQNAHERAWVSDWLRALMALITANVDFDGQQMVNHEQNRLIGEIIQGFESH